MAQCMATLLDKPGRPVLAPLRIERPQECAAWFQVYRSDVSTLAPVLLAPDFIMIEMEKEAEDRANETGLDHEVEDCSAKSIPTNIVCSPEPSRTCTEDAEDIPRPRDFSGPTMILWSFISRKEHPSALRNPLLQHRSPTTPILGEVVDEHDLAGTSLQNQGILLAMLDQGAELSRLISAAAEDVASPSVQKLCSSFSILIDGLSLFNNYVSTYGGQGALERSGDIILEFKQLMADIQQAVHEAKSSGVNAADKGAIEVAKLSKQTKSLLKKVDNLVPTTFLRGFEKRHKLSLGDTYIRLMLKSA